MSKLNQTVLITGASGLLGNNLVNFFSNKYEKIVACYKSHNLSYADSNVVTEKIDLSDYKELNQILNKYHPALIINCAGLTNVDVCEGNPQLAASLNGDIAGEIAKFSNLNNTQYIYISTDHLFNGDKQFYSEEDPVFPLNVYANTKLLGERLSLQNCPQALIIRTNFFGVGTTWRQSFSDWIFTSLNSGKELPAFVDSYFSPIAIPELIKILAMLIDKQAHGIYNVCGSERLSKFDFAKKFAEFFNLPKKLIQPIKLEQANLKAQRPLDMSLSTQKLTSILGIKAPTVAESFKAIESGYKI